MAEIIVPASCWMRRNCRKLMIFTRNLKVLRRPVKCEMGWDGMVRGV